jgi:hypothetical protein
MRYVLDTNIWAQLAQGNLVTEEVAYCHRCKARQRKGTRVSLIPEDISWGDGLP